MAIAEIVLTASVALLMLSVLIYAPFWLLAGLSRRRRRPQERALRWWPLIAVLSLAAMILIVIVSNADAVYRFGNLTVWSSGIFLCTILFAVASLASAVALGRTNRKDVRRAVRRYSILVAVALLIATAYLAYWGVIGLRTWA
jgi:hypothetical protein